MGKAAMCIKMLQILNSGRIYKASELADLMETNPRNIIEYRKELEEAGYTIIPIPGKYGGYQLDQTTLIPSLRLTQEEQEALAEGSGYLVSRNDFAYKKSYELAMSKIYSSLKHESIQTNPSVVNRFPLLMPETEIAARYKAMEECIKLHYKIEIEYLSLKNEVTTRTLHPYKLFMYNNAWYVLGYDEKSESIRYFKLNRIQQYKQMIGRKFRVLYSYNESDYLDEYGMKQNGEWYPIKLRVTGPYAMLVRERIYGRNQSVECVDNDTTILSCEMQNKENIKVFVLGFGEHCQVLEPEWLQESIRETVSLIGGKNV